MYVIIYFGKGKCMKGRVKWWSNEKGYGFIEYSESENVFVHIVENDKEIYPLKEEQEIEFNLEEKNNFIYLQILKTLEN